MRLRPTVAAVLLLGISSSAAGFAQSSGSFGLRRFDDQVAAYMKIREDANSRVGAPVISSNAGEIIEREALLASAIRKARPHAAAGDIFNDVVAFEIRTRIRAVLDRHHVSERAVLADAGAEAPLGPAPIGVNGAFDWRFGAAMPASFIAVLPPVPWPLEYRFVSANLVLLDVEARLIVDVLPDVLTAR